MINCIQAKDLTIEELKAEFTACFDIFFIAEKIMLGGKYATHALADVRYDGAFTDVRFFLNRLLFVSMRAREALNELQRREVRSYDAIALNFNRFRGVFPKRSWKGWVPTPGDVELNKKYLEMHRVLTRKELSYER